MGDGRAWGGAKLVEPCKVRVIDCSSFSSSSVRVRFLGADGPGRDMVAVAVFTGLSTVLCSGRSACCRSAMRGLFGGAFGSELQLELHPVMSAKKGEKNTTTNILTTFGLTGYP